MFRTNSLISETYPSGRVLLTNYDDADRLLSVANWYTSTAYVSSASYAANGAITGLTMNNGLTEARTYNRRFQPISITAKPSPTQTSMETFRQATGFRKRSVRRRV
jgi:YD repeat-containing protein